MSVTIKDVARAAGVSPSTVSRVISRHPKISPATARKVREAMESLGYHPNIMAKSLVSKSTQTIGLVLPRSAEELFVNPFFSEVLRGMLAYANTARYDMLMSSATSQQEELDAVTRMVLGRRVDGLILMAPRLGDPIIERLLELDFPFVLLGRSPEHEDLFLVNNNNVSAGYDATHHLISLGHTRIGFVGGPPDMVVIHDRLTGYKQALEEVGLPFRDEWVINADLLQKSGFHAVSVAMNYQEKPTAFVIADDIVAFGMIRGLCEAGLSVPEDVSVISFNNIMLSELSNPPISTIDIGIYHLGYLTVQQLIRRLSGESSLQKQVIVPHRLIVRGSSGAPRPR
ncbi:LacI family transcriptional regulator [Brevibacillus humidisoli]|uniref:LacI family DNA-binding transcriptional regulator n=1 Tax=Brevibacillus humidisoli TaxID=2895522 RepID=UPI001E42EC6D|nr:LacI family DNA-binding transcriptional regulator [Brevibacillus humidisoli]UFJ39399.1 LacI family transcriptional regulator [Brevibacillus humidisoli]